MWETSAAGLVGTVAFAAVGLMLLSALLSAPANSPIAEDVAIGMLFLLISPVFVPAVLLFVTGKFRMLGRSVRIAFDCDGLEGWQVAAFRTTKWADLRHPRLERRVLVLPFSWPSADAWAVVPARAFSPAQFERLLDILQEAGIFVDGDRQSPMGGLLSFVAGRTVFGRGASEPGHLVTFPRLLKERRAR